MARPTTRTKVHDAVLVLAADSPLRAITMEGIAARAGVSKQTLYRSWPSIGSVLFDALLARSTDENNDVVVPNSGHLETDLAALATGMIAELTEPTQDRLLRAVTAEIQTDEELATQFRELLLEPQSRAITKRLHEAGADAADDIAELFVGPILHRWLLRSRPFTPEWIAAHVSRTIKATTLRDA